MLKLLVVGIDGATWTVIDPMLARGELPHLASLRQRGVSGTLEAFQYRLNSALLWTSINTGKMPEKHGVEFFGAASTDIRCKRIWEIFEAQGWAIGVCGELVTWPPKPVNGFLIPDLFALDARTYPEGLRFLQELALGEKNGESSGRLAILTLPWKLLKHGVRPGTIAAMASFMLHRKLGDHHDFLSWFWRKALLQPRIYTDVAAHLAKTLDLDYLSFHFHCTDTLSHRYWCYWDPESFSLVDPQDIERYGDVVPAAYREADRTLGRLLRLAGPDTAIVVVSDHGFRAITYGQNYQYSLRLERLMRLIGLDTDNVVPARLGAEYAFYLKNPALQSKIIESLSAMRIEPSGEPLFNVRETEGFVSFELADRGRELTTASLATPFGALRFDDLFEDRGFVDSGTHQQEGIIILAGQGIQPGTLLSPPSPVDVAPTLLALAGVPVPRDMDGRVLSEAMTAEFLARYPIRYCDSYDDANCASPTGTERGVDSDVVLERLEALGYL